MFQAKTPEERMYAMDLLNPDEDNQVTALATRRAVSKVKLMSQESIDLSLSY